MNKPLELGAEIKPYGKIEGIRHFADGERYYFLSNGENDVSFMPATVIEHMYRKR